MSICTIINNGFNSFLLSIKKVKKLFAHFITIKNDPLKFVLWILTSIVLSLSTVWVPAILGLIVGKDLFHKQMGNNPFIIFSIVFLSNTILNSINQIGAGSNRFAVLIRSITLVIIIMYLVVLSAIIPLKLMDDITLGIQSQFILLLIAIALGIYVYGFRETDWEKDVNDFRDKENKEVKKITNSASALTTDGENKL